MRLKRKVIKSVVLQHLNPHFLQILCNAHHLIEWMLFDLWYFHQRKTKIEYHSFCSFIYLVLWHFYMRRFDPWFLQILHKYFYTFYDTIYMNDCWYDIEDIIFDVGNNVLTSVLDVGNNLRTSNYAIIAFVI